ncbi:ribosomal maturation YjgA family protein [Sphingopyxis panaciterrae]
MAPRRRLAMLSWRPGYALAALFLLLVEVAIALWVRDNFVRPYLGDVLAVILVYLALRAVTTLRPVPAALAALAVGVVVEIGQAIDLLGLLNLSDNRVARIVLGSSFGVGDLFCYAAGAAIAVLAEQARKRTATPQREKKHGF